MSPQDKIKAQKTKNIEMLFSQIMHELGLPLNDSSLKDTPLRVAKMYVNELFTSLDDVGMPKLTTFDNKYRYDQMVVETDIEINTTCEHHFVPIIGVAHIAYIPQDFVLGLSKLNRVAHHYCKRPQVQERLTRQIKDKLDQTLKTKDVAVAIDAKHMCVKIRGVRDSNCTTTTTSLGGRFLEDIETRNEFFQCIDRNSNFK